jgi:lysophospholipase L1-like esterase
MKKIALWFLATLLLLELFLQAGALILKEHSWRAKSQWLSGNVRILALGDSNTYGLYLPAEDSYPAQLETLWNLRHPDAPVEVINLGYPGTNSFRLLANLPEILETFQPDLVLLMIGFNDFWTPVEVPATASELSWLKKLQLHSRLYQLFYMAFRTKQLEYRVDTGDRMLGDLSNINFTPEELAYIKEACGFDLETISQLTKEQLSTKPELMNALEAAIKSILEKRKQQETPDSILNTVKYGEKVFSLGIAEGSSAGNSKKMPDNIKMMLALMEERNIPYFLLNYPTRFGYYAPTNKKITSLIGESEIPFIDLQDVLHADCQKKPEKCPELLFYDAHATAKGNQLIAEKIARELENQLVTPSHLSR